MYNNVGVGGIEPPTFSMSMKRSTTELNARHYLHNKTKNINCKYKDESIGQTCPYIGRRELKETLPF